MYTLNGIKKIMMNIKNNILSGVKIEISKAPDKKAGLDLQWLQIIRIFSLRVFFGPLFSIQLFQA